MRRRGAGSVDAETPCETWWGTEEAPRVMGEAGVDGDGFGRGRRRTQGPHPSPDPTLWPGLNFREKVNMAFTASPPHMVGKLNSRWEEEDGMDAAFRNFR